MRSLIQTIAFVCLIAASAYSQTNTLYMVSRMDGSLEMSNGNTTTVWGYCFYDGDPQDSEISLPAPTIRVNYGDSVVIHMENISQEAHTIHLHGLDVNQVNDGVPSTSFYVFFGESVDYSFRAPHPGTYLYHCHVTTSLHLTMGMYGLLVVEYEEGSQQLYENGPFYDSVYEYLCSDLDRSWNDNPISVGPNLHLFEADYFMINGLSEQMLFENSEQVVTAEAGDRVLLRLGNIAYSNTKFVFPQGLNATVYTSDGRVLPEPVQTDTLDVFPGERYQVMLEPDAYIEDYIQVFYEDMYQGAVLGQNFIGVNLFTAPVSIDESEQETLLLLYPNPANDIIRIPSANGNSKLEVYDSSGRIIYTGSPSNGTINCHQWPSGMYFLHMNGQSASVLVSH